MTIASTNNRNIYSGNGATTSFGFAYPFFDASDLLVFLVETDRASHAIDTSSIALNGGGAYGYIVTGPQDAATGEYLSGATLKFKTAPPVGYQVVLLRAVPQAQVLTLRDNAKFPAKSVEASLDRLTLLAQDLAGASPQSLQAPNYETPNFVLPNADGRRNCILRFDANGDAAVEPFEELVTFLVGWSLGAGSTGTGAIVLQNQPTLVLPNIASIANGGVLTLPSGTHVLVGRDTSDVFTGKAYDTAGAGNVFKINGMQVSDITGAGKVVLDTSPQLTTPGFLTIVNGAVTLTLPNSSDTLVGRATTDTFLHKTFDTAGAGNVLAIAGTAINAVTGSGSVVLASGATLVDPIIARIGNGANFWTMPPAAPGVLVAEGTTQTLLAKTVDSASNTLKIAGVTVSGLTGSGGSLVMANGPTLSGVVLSDNKVSNGAADITFPPGPATLMSVNGAQSPTNKTFDAAANTITNLAVSMFATNVIDTDAGLSANSNSRLATQAAVKAYVDAHAAGFSPKLACACATTGNITLSGEQTIDGIATGLSRVLVMNQTTPRDNGIYTSSSGAWIRATDMDSWAEVPGAFTFVSAGTINGKTGWACISAAGGTLGTTAIVWAQFSAPGSYTAGAGLTLTGTQFAIDGTVVTLSGAQTLTAKTLTDPIIARIGNGANFWTMPPAAPGVLVAEGTTQTLVAKTFDSASNTLKIAGVTVSGLTGSGGSLVMATGATLVDPIINRIGNGANFWTMPPAAPGILVAEATTQPLSNKGIDAAANTITNLAVSMFATNVADTDGALAHNGDDRFATQKAVKTYADTKLSKTGGTVSGNIVMGAGAAVVLPTSSTPGLASAALGAVRYAADEGGGPALIYDDGSNHRRVSDGQVASATLGARGLLACLSARAPDPLRALINGVFAQLDAAGLTAKLKGLWVYAMPNRADAKLNWITPTRNPLAEVGTLTFTANQGFTGDGASGLLDTQLTLATIGISSQDDVAAGIYLLTASAAPACVIGQNGSAAGRRVYLQSATSGALAVRVSDTAGDTFSPVRYVGLHVIARVNNAAFSAYVDDAGGTTVLRASVAAAIGNIAFLGTVDTAGSEFSTAKAAFSFLANGSLSAADIANLRAILVDYFLVGVGAVTASVVNLPPAANFKGQTYYVADLGGGSGLMQSDGVNWARAGGDGYEVLSDANVVLIPLKNGAFQNMSATLTANRTLTLLGADAKLTAVKHGTKFMVTRTGLGAFTYAVIDATSGLTLKTFAASTTGWAVFVFDAVTTGHWQMVQDGPL